MSVNFVTRLNGEVRSFSTPKYVLSEIQDIDFFLSPETNFLFKELQAHSKSLNSASIDAFLAPSNEGLVVVDFDSKWLGDFQGYTFLGRFHEAVLYRSMKESKQQNKDPVFVNLLKKAMDFGAISAIQWIEVPKNTKEDTKWSKGSLEESGLTTFSNLFSFLQKQWEQELKGEFLSKEIHSLIFSPPGWTFERFNKDNPEDYFKIVRALFAKGFDLTCYVEAWQDYADQIIDRDEEQKPLKEFQPLANLQAFIIEFAKTKLNEALPKTSKIRLKKTL